jgi:hypothetical protein
MQTATPKVFISYSWSSDTHKQRVLDWANRLIEDGIDVIIDQYDLNEGDDIYEFMESMVLDNSVTHVLVISDKTYADKANKRTSGVGTESQIISQEIYSKTKNSKFIPIACEFDESNNAYFPAFIKSRLYIDFTSDERVNENWERLVRILYGKPELEKPSLGKPPLYITNYSKTPAGPAEGKLSQLKMALNKDTPNKDLLRTDFLETCYKHIDQLRLRVKPEVENIVEKLYNDYRVLVQIRDQIIDWYYIEGRTSSENVLSDIITEVLQHLLSYKYRPIGINGWNENWYESHKTFVYEIFLYIVAASIKMKLYKVLHNIYTKNYMLPESEQSREYYYEKYDIFYHSSDVFQTSLSDTTKYLSPTAELVKRNANRDDTTFKQIQQADLLCFFMGLARKYNNWYPQTVIYATYGEVFEFFLKQTFRDECHAICTISGINFPDVLRSCVTEEFNNINLNGWHRDFRNPKELANYMKIDAIGTID